MPNPTDPTDPIRRRAVLFPGVAKGTSCTQSAFKAGKGTFLFIGPGPKGRGFKAMFRLNRSMPQARALAARDPSRFEVGSTGWVTARFSAEKPLPKAIWSKWLTESHEVAYGGKPGTPKRAPGIKKRPSAAAARKKATKRGRSRSKG